MAFLAGLCSTAQGQKNLSLSAQYPIFLDDLRFIYQASPGLRIGYSSMGDDDGESSERSLDFGLGVYRFQPKDTIFYYLVNDNEVGSIKYSNYWMFQLKMGCSYVLRPSERTEMYFGVDFGYYYVFLDTEYNEPGRTGSSSSFQGMGVVAPKAGVNILVGERIGLTYQSSFDFYTTLGGGDEYDPFTYNPEAGNFNYFITNSLGAYLRF